MSTGKRDAAKQDTRNALIAAGAAEFTEKGIEGASLDAICARAGFTRGAFYVHFKDRDELLAAIVDVLLRGFHDAVISTGEGADLQTTIARYVAAVLTGSPATRSIGRWQFHNTLAACTRTPALRTRYLELQRQAMAKVAEGVRAGQHDGTVRTDVDPDALAEMLVILTLGITVMNDLKYPLDIARGGATVSTLVSTPKRRRKVRKQ
jgi:TetR/AcrR family transcriptional regulator, transcriptional repressor for nem operon